MLVLVPYVRMYGTQARWFTIKILFPRVRLNAYRNSLISLSNPPLIPQMGGGGGGRGGGGGGRTYH